MGKKHISVFLTLLMVLLSISIASNSLNKEVELPLLEEVNEPQNVILPPSQLNEPGHQEGSIFTDATLSSGGDHTCAIIDNGSVSCWGLGNKGQLGNGDTDNQYSPTLVTGLGTGRTAVSISSGYSHTCAVLDNGDVSCWGENNVGQLGNGGNLDSTTPTLTNSLGLGRTAVAISTGIAHTCAILDNGLVSCWGSGNYGQIGNGDTFDTTSPTLTNTLGSGQTVVALSSGGYHTCAILDNGEVTCWGFGSAGQLGNGATSDKNSPTLTNSFGSGRIAVAITTGEYFTCALLNDASVSCWGYGSNGQLGNGATSDANTPTPTSSLGSGATAIAISAGNRYMCAILNNGDLSCWGYGGDGQLGNGDVSDKTVATTTNSLGAGRTPVAISSGLSHTCAILDNGDISCWGAGTFGRLGNGETTTQNSPTLTSGFPSMQKVALSERDFDGDGILNIFEVNVGLDMVVTALSSGSEHNCAILDNGSVSCWGRGDYGQIGNGDTTQKDTPTLTSSLGTGRTAVAISSGGHHTCAILDNGAVSCWGAGTYGQLGNGAVSDKSTPTLTGSLGTGRTAVAISSGTEHTCAILDNGSVSCWGRASWSQLGNGDSTQKNTPTLTSSLGAGRTAVAISSGGQHSCAILDNGEVSCWGNYYYGQMGNGASSNQPTPTLTDSLGAGRTAVALFSGLNFNCVILDNGLVSCWGQAESNGQLGNGAAVNKNTPTLTSSLGAGRTAVGISSGYYHACAILDNGAVSCWGRGAWGQLGNGDTSNQFTPTLTGSLGTGRTAVALSTGSAHTCAILDNGSVSCWGDGRKGQLGNGDTTQKNTPTFTSIFGTFTSIGNTIQSVECNAGQYGRYVCVNAPLGKHSPSNSAMYATDCPAGTYQATTGRTFCNGADVGHYVDSSLGTSQSSQTACLAGTYNPATESNSSSACGDADAGYYVSNTGQSSQNACSPGTYNPNTGSTNSSACGDADAGHFVGHPAQSSQEPCTPGNYQPITKQTSCIDADAGYKVENSSETAQEACAIGTYQALTGQTFCDDADPGHYVGLPGQFEQSICLAGTYQPSEGQSFCIGASFGFYVLLDGAVRQIACPSQTSTIEIGSKLVSDCILDTDSDLLPDVIDPDDDADGTIDLEDAFPLDASEDKDTDGDGRGDNMQSIEEAEQTRLILIVVAILLVTASVVGVLVMRSRKEDEESDWHQEDNLFDEEDHVKPPSGPPQTTRPSMKKQVDYVATWQELPTGDWLETDENGTNWYKANDGTHWYSSDDGYRLYNE